MFKYAEKAKRLQDFIEEQKWSKAEFARRMGIPQQNVNRYLSGELDPMNLAEELFNEGCNVEWLMTGKKKAARKEVEFSDVEFMQIPVFEYARAGTKSMALLERPSYFISSAKSKDDTLFAVVVKGNSMEPEVKEGELVVVSKKRDLKKGDLCLIMFEDGDCCLRRVYFQDHTVTLTSSNEREYPPAIHKKSEIRFIYRVVQKTTNY